MLFLEYMTACYDLVIILLKEFSGFTFQLHTQYGNAQKYFVKSEVSFTEIAKIGENYHTLCPATQVLRQINFG